jgi:hypothetical protein
MAIYKYAIILMGVTGFTGASSVFAQAAEAAKSAVQIPSMPRAGQIKDDTSDDILSPEEWRKVDAAVERALAWLATQQQTDGSFPTLDSGQPGVTSLCVLAFMAHGHNPGEHEYGQQLERAIDYILSCQKPNGLVALLGPDGPKLSRDIDDTIGVTAAYNHAISSLALAEVYGMTPSRRALPLRGSIAKALRASLQMQRWTKGSPDDRGGWRYVVPNPESESDLSITGWELMFLRSARNAGFDVPNEPVDDAVKYVRRCFDREYGSFRYVIGNTVHGSRAMAGAGILALGHAGFHNSAEAKATGKWLLQYPFAVYNESRPPERHDRYHYSLFNCCQGMYQLGNPYWKEFFPPTVRVVLGGQQANGSWQAERYQRDRQFGNAYSTALVVLALGAPNQLLPIFQR